jgi:hypothetical protein
MIAAKRAWEPVPAEAPAPVATPGRARRLAAVLADVVAALAAQLGGLLLALVWLLAVTDRGRFDPTVREAEVAWALLFAALPAWFAWLAVRAARHRQTAAQRRLGVRIEAATGARAVLRLALHPLTALGWLWFAGFATLLGHWQLALGALALAGGWLAAGLLSGLLLLRSRDARPLHDRLAGTRLVACRPEREAEAPARSLAKRSAAR